MNEILTQEQFLIQESVKYINTEWEKGLDSWFNIGEYVIVNFYDDNLEKISSKAWNKDVSFRKLCEHPELRMPMRSLALCTELVRQDRLYFTVCCFDSRLSKQQDTVQAPAQSLPKGHKQLLLQVPPDDKIETAVEIADLSYRDARDWIKQKYQSETGWWRRSRSASMGSGWSG